MPEQEQKKHFNLYYIFLEDQKANPMSQKRADAIRQALFAGKPPPADPKPPP